MKFARTALSRLTCYTCSTPNGVSCNFEMYTVINTVDSLEQCVGKVDGERMKPGWGEALVRISVPPALGLEILNKTPCTLPQPWLVEIDIRSRMSV